MHRPKPASIVFLVMMLCSLAGLAAGCAQAPEQQYLDRYFGASRLRDNTTLANIATVAFRPSEEGTVQDFDITNVGAEGMRPLRVRELADAYEKARAADEEFGKKRKDYQDANIEAIDRVLKAERAGQRVSGRDAAVQATWSKMRDEMNEHAGRLSEAREALAAERGVAELSVFDASNPIDITKYDGEFISKDVTISAQVRTPAGETVSKTLVVTMQRAELKGEGGRSGRWIITAIRESAGGAPTSN